MFTCTVCNVYHVHVVQPMDGVMNE